MRPLDSHWSSLTHASHCMTTSRPAAATQTRARVSPAIAMHLEVFSTSDTLPATIVPISRLGNWLRICCLVYCEATLHTLRQNVKGYIELFIFYCFFLIYCKCACPICYVVYCSVCTNIIAWSVCLRFYILYQFDFLSLLYIYYLS